MDSLSYLIIALIVLAVLILIFFIFRELNCWYWKIDERLMQQKRTNFLLEKIFIQNGGKIDVLNGDDDVKEVKFSSEGLNEDLYNQLNDNEKSQVKGFVRYGIKKGYKIALNKVNRKFDTFDIKRWEQISKEGLSDRWIIIIEK